MEGLPAVRMTKFRLLPLPGDSRGRATLHATFSGTDVFDSTAGRSMPTDFKVGALFTADEATGRLALDEFALWPDVPGQAYDHSLRPGMSHVLSMSRLLVERLHEQFPWATDVDFHGRRVTEGDGGSRAVHVKL